LLGSNYMAAKKNIYTCQSCASQFPKWQGRCTECGAWNSLVEETFEKTDSQSKSSFAKSFSVDDKVKDLLSDEVDSKIEEKRLSSGFDEVDRVFGGGLLPGSVFLIGGQPGIGKSTLLVKILAFIAKQKKQTLYISGEESLLQVRNRAKRLKIEKSQLLKFISTLKLEEAMLAIQKSKAEFVVLDSIQALSSSEYQSAAGTVTQVRSVVHELVETCKKNNICALLVGQVTKEGSIAGPKVVEHLVDGVFSLEFSNNGLFRLLKAMKNRFGPTDESAVLEMTELGLSEVKDPSARFLAERVGGIEGSALFAELMGTRSVLTEIQVLSNRTFFPHPKRVAQGIDQNRFSVLIAVIEKILGISFAEQDVYCKVASGTRINDAAADLSIVASLLSSRMQKALPEKALFIGEVGLGGEVRNVVGINSRVKEAAKMGINQIYCPTNALKEIKEKDLDLKAIKNIEQLKNALF